jgi:hypothetical protein
MQKLKVVCAPSDCRLVLHLPVVGNWTLTPSNAILLVIFLVLMDHYASVVARRERLKDWKAAEKKRTGIKQE